MEKRIVIPELLDRLPSDDPEALRSRRDLRRINFLMGNERWVCRTAKSFRKAAEAGIVEIGAGDGALANKLARLFPEARIEAYDLVRKPATVVPQVVWHQGDLFEQPAIQSHGILVANLFLHHFEKDALSILGRKLENFRVLILCEPDRARLPHLLGGLMHPWINSVTRHDMHVSISAGFAAGELGAWLGLDPALWEIRESSTWRGARRVVACRV